MRQRSLRVLRTFTVWTTALLATTTLGAPVLAQSPSPSPIAAPPATELTIVSTYPSKEVDPGSEASFPLLVTSPTPERVDFTVTAPADFDASLLGEGSIVASVFTNPAGAEPPDLELTVQVPDNAAPGSYPVEVAGTSESGSASLTVDLIVADISGGQVTLDTEFDVLEGTSDADTVFDVTLTNDTSQEISFALQGAGPEGWTVDVRPQGETQASTITVPAGDEGSISVTVTPSRLAEAGTYDLVVAATSDVPGGSDELPLQVVITGDFGLQVTTPDERLNATVTAGSSTNLTVRLVNTGTAPLENVTLEATPPRDWEVVFSPEIVPVINPGEFSDVTAAITPVGNAVAGDYQLTISASNDQVDESVQIRTAVETSSIWGIVGIALIAVVLIGLFLVFRRFGRR
jgi:uncharacterized membrane protein